MLHLLKEDISKYTSLNHLCSIIEDTGRALVLPVLPWGYIFPIAQVTVGGENEVCGSTGIYMVMGSLLAFCTRILNTTDTRKTKLYNYTLS